MNELDKIQQMERELVNLLYRFHPDLESYPRIIASLNEILLMQVNYLLKKKATYKEREILDGIEKATKKDREKRYKEEVKKPMNQCLNCGVTFVDNVDHQCPVCGLKKTSLQEKKEE